MSNHCNCQLSKLNNTNTLKDLTFTRNGLVRDLHWQIDIRIRIQYTVYSIKTIQMNPCTQFYTTNGLDRWHAIMCIKIIISSSFASLIFVKQFPSNGRHKNDTKTQYCWFQILYYTMGLWLIIYTDKEMWRSVVVTSKMITETSF